MRFGAASTLSSAARLISSSRLIFPIWCCATLLLRVQFEGFAGSARFHNPFYLRLFKAKLSAKYHDERSCWAACLWRWEFAHNLCASKILKRELQISFMNIIKDFCLLFSGWFELFKAVYFVKQLLYSVQTRLEYHF
jgi:hypothetical protein